MPIITIGGASLKHPKTKEIANEILSLSKKKHPQFLFIPTASSDDEEYCERMKTFYEKLGAKVAILKLITEIPSKKIYSDMIARADIIYVGGGNTLMMMKKWRRLGIDTLLKKAYKEEKILCGVSAGSICWYEYGHSDSLSYYHPEKWKYIRVKGLGLLQGTHCPHYDSETLGIKRRENFHKMLQKISGRGIAIDDCAALLYTKDSVEVLPRKGGGNVYILEKEKGTHKEHLLQKGVKYPLGKKFPLKINFSTL